MEKIFQNTNQHKYDEIISEIEDVDLSDISLRDKYIQLKRILERCCKEITRIEPLQFPSLFSRLVFIAQKYEIPKNLEQSLQSFRIIGTFLLRNEQNTVTTSQYRKARESIKILIAKVFSIQILIEKNTLSEEEPDYSPTKKTDYIRIQVISIDKDNKLISGEARDATDTVIHVRYNVQNINEVFDNTVDRIWIGAQLNLLDCKLDDSGYYIPQFIILEPDYLIDTSAMAECFQNYGKSHLHYFRRKFEQTPNSQYILLGNLANFFLDELVFAKNPENLHFNDIFLESFKQKPFEYTSCTDIQKTEDFRTFMAKAKVQFENIKRVVTQDFPRNDIDVNQCTLEPSFFSERYGFQGRLDLLQLSDSDDKIIKIVELKSGGLPFPKDDRGKIAINHEVQTTIYRLIIQSVFGVSDRKISASILYSAAENAGENLRFSATYHRLEKEIINIRNLIVATEHDLYLGDNSDCEKLFRDIFNFDNYGRIPDFFKKQIEDLEKVINNISSVEKEYFFRYITFVSRELYLQKVGDDYFESANSTASLWNTEYQERKDSFDLISDLEISEINESGRDMTILFRRKDNSDFINFREGEICILYPHNKENDTVLNNQILKGTIAKISSEHILLRFRYKQKNHTFLRKYKSWTVEHDRLDQTYNNMYKNLFSFLTSSIDKRLLLLGLKEPNSDYVGNSTPNLSIEEKQKTVLEKAIAAKDYFLIVGPPGTGKTSVFARNLIQYYHTNTNNNILIIAYTNRAVDELCEAINQAFDCDNYECTDYIRIGTELSCGENYRHRLLQNIAQEVKSREELRNIIKERRIFIGTLAAILSRPEIFDIKQFHISIIDEASQILEPQIIGILPKVDKFIMIGDHKQLSTITLQDKSRTIVDNPQLNIIELYNCNESLFERLFRICQKKEWENTFDTLVYQGRMHEEIAQYPNKYFYDGILKPIHTWQNDKLVFSKTDSSDIFQKIVSENRVAFISHEEHFNALSDKVNYGEARIAVLLSEAILKVYEANNLHFDTQKSLGIITPYRNQIALIKHKLAETGISELQNIMVDTVERFQGSQRDIIILSFCINKSYQLNFFSNTNTEGTVDRKLNVALTRARQQLFMIGNEYLLRQNYFYRLLLKSVSTISI